MQILSKIIHNYLPLWLSKILVSGFAGFRSKEKYGLIKRPWYAYGLLSAADQAVKHGIDRITVIEFGVAAGRGLRNLAMLSKEVSAITGVKIDVVGFDTGSGMPPTSDYRDHPEVYREGDYPMLDQEKLRNDVGGDVNLIIGDITETVDDFRDSLDGSSPIGFIAVDVDIYSSTVDALRLFDGETKLYMPMVFSYFDDSSSRSHFNKFCGELLAIDEFNQKQNLKKIDNDRGIWNSHRRLGPQIWHERMFILHVFDHPLRFPIKKRKAKILPQN